MGICGSQTCAEFFLGHHSMAEAAAIVGALLLLEAVLSFDNAAILAAMVRRLPINQRRKALMYGLVGAYILRIAAIILAAWLIKNQWLKIVGGAYLFFLFAKHYWSFLKHKPEHGHRPVGGEPFLVRLGVPMLVATIIQIELIDLAFAIDQVIVAVGFTDVIGLIIVAAMIGILFLRLAAAFLARVMDWLPVLEHMAYVAVGYVGIKLILLHPYFDIHIPNAVSLTFTFGLFVLPVLVKLVFKWPPSQEGLHEPPH